MTTSTCTLPRIVSRDEWLEARKTLLNKEKEATRARDALNAQRRVLPWVKVEKNYVFDGPDGRETLADLFEARSQLIVHHFMFVPAGGRAASGARSRPTTLKGRSCTSSTTM
jgi:predicted dithiol-disulfide oxidoreductase (DUF899 family)